jgi:hypothetical protein
LIGGFLAHLYGLEACALVNCVLSIALCWEWQYARSTHGVGAWKGLELVGSFSRFVEFQIGDVKGFTFGMSFGMLTSC